LASIKDGQATGEAFGPQHPALQNMKFLNDFESFNCFGPFLPSWIRVRIQPTKINAKTITIDGYTFKTPRLILRHKRCKKHRLRAINDTVQGALAFHFVELYVSTVFRIQIQFNCDPIRIVLGLRIPTGLRQAHKKVKKFSYFEVVDVLF
jgi:hypothetical protein